jgi:hypothetical protein
MPRYGRASLQDGEGGIDKAAEHDAPYPKSLYRSMLVKDATSRGDRILLDRKITNCREVMYVF